MKLDMNALMKQAREMQEQMAKAQEEAKNELEVRFGYLFQDDDVGAEMDGLLAAIAPVIAVVGGPPKRGAQVGQLGSCLSRDARQSLSHDTARR